ncbi:O-acetyl-ADP-ribose deacetylase (regulator of RNase III) [Sinobaca qinghaiensis]|uniref:O-acetyl-ADP-ribose deacetylase (Regulator of RNase III) n=1 Tax=Sinobaca qinghaiensis TaxID=342944 RepID=A0A419UWE7_9BACL|nr:macro domain-containing protein [Sinobaca qinghaiensis]RKD69463.1 O-acetyl-ADP-ribose deacetylase (regulator of RNase III) [Sinobaca qinghaiensis]
MQKQINGVLLEVVQGNIASQPDMDAVVNAANAALQTGGGVAGALHGAAGPELAEAGGKYAPISPGEAVITEAFHLPNQYVIHCLGPVYGKDKPEEKLLAGCYMEALNRAEENHIKRVAFPSLSTGAFGYPLEEAASTALHAVLEKIPSLQNVKHIRFVLFSDSDASVYKRLLEESA